MQKWLADKLVEDCTETIKETKLVEITSAKNENKHMQFLNAVHCFIFNIFYNKRWNW